MNETLQSPDVPRRADFAVISPRESSASPATSPSPNFDRLARPYRWLEYLSFGPLLQRTRTHFFSQLASCRNALVLGDGDGRFTAALLRANQQIGVHAVDLSPAMLRTLTRAAAPHQRRLTTESADLRDWTPSPSEPLDLIATHFFLDCLTTPEVTTLATRLAAVTAPDAVWIVSDFATPPTLYGRLLATPLVALLYRAFRLLTGLGPQTLPDHAAALAAAGWTLESQHTRLGGLLLSQLWRQTNAPC
jgi:SAM-dependent methyltransferase